MHANCNWLRYFFDKLLLALFVMTNWNKGQFSTNMYVITSIKYKTFNVIVNEGTRIFF
jgi:hypothetical protein